MKYVKSFVIFLSLLSVFFLVLNIGVKKRIQLKLCNYYDVEVLDIHHDSLSFHLEMDATTGEWFIQSGKNKDMAYGDGLETITKVLCYLPFTEEFKLEKPLTEDELRSYGLLNKDFTVSARTRNKEEISLQFGGPTPSGTELYHINSKKPDHLYTVPNNFPKTFKLSYLEFLPRTLFSDLKKTGTQKFKINYQGHEWSWLQGQKTWQDTSKTISDEQSQKMIDLVASLRYERYLGPLTSDQKSLYGVDYPDVTFSWTKNDGTVSDHGLISLNSGNYLSYPLDDEDYLLIISSEKLAGFIELLKTLARQESVSPENTL